MAKSYLYRRVESVKGADTGISIILALTTNAATGLPIWETMHEDESVKFTTGCHDKLLRNIVGKNTELKLISSQKQSTTHCEMLEHTIPFLLSAIMNKSLQRWQLATNLYLQMAFLV
ncbi:hypothetical protein KIN20_015706 [Parelaphostrongylus tenuis]|uniref:Uncharacterized protein n=1 Tax=Parelaphostrongylus tenuis TaxID=148309 RepID=A0AAD5QQ89_PARTN|nr:hypothetical protein KIN20_015706 [Parelaphostrongylus tenuis]